MYQTLNTEPDIEKPVSSFLNKTEGALSKRALYELFLLSAFIFTMSALLIQFLMNLQTAILLRHYSISFTYSLFSVNFTSVSGAKWIPIRIYIVYGIVALELFFAGIIILLFKIKNWKIKLVFTWLAFLMIHTLPLGMLAGIYIYDGFGIAYTWLFQNIIVRVLITLAVLLIAIYCRPYWIFRFLKTANSREYLDDELYREKYIRYCFILPWCFGAGIVSAFALPHLTWVWFVFIFGLGIVVLPIFSKTIPFHEILIYKSEKKIFAFRYPFLYFIIAAATGVIWLISLIRIFF